MRKSRKIRHQLFLTEELSRRLGALARSSGRARSEILVEALEALFNRRSAPPADEMIAARLQRLERSADRLDRMQHMIWEAIARIVRHQLMTAAALPPPDASAQAIARKQFQAFIDDVARLLANEEGTLLEFGPVVREQTRQ